MINRFGAGLDRRVRGHLVLDGFLDIVLAPKIWPSLIVVDYPSRILYPRKLSFLSKGLKFLPSLHHYNSLGTRFWGGIKACDSSITCHLPFPSILLCSTSQIHPLIRTSLFSLPKYFLDTWMTGRCSTGAAHIYTKMPG